MANMMSRRFSLDLVAFKFPRPLSRFTDHLNNTAVEIKVMGFRLFAVLLVMVSILLVACGGESTASFSDPAISRGQRVFKRDCVTCHSTKPGVNLVGPSMAGIASRAGNREEGMDSRGYIQLSITKPSEYIVDGFVDQMPATFGSSLSDEELDNVIAYLLTLE